MKRKKSMSDENQLPPAASAAAAASSGDATMAQALQAVETLVSLYGFPYPVANQAVQEVGVDVNECTNYILEHNLAQDQGGAVYPIDTCPHLATHIQVTVEQLKLLSKEKNPHHLPCGHYEAKKKTKQAQLKSGEDGTIPKEQQKPAIGRLKDDEEESSSSSCPAGENWLCLECGVVRCSRYVNGHGLVHWEDTKQDSPSSEGHCVAVSLADLSVWCHVCASYVRSATLLDPLVQQLQVLKFGKEEEEKDESKQRHNEKLNNNDDNSPSSHGKERALKRLKSSSIMEDDDDDDDDGKAEIQRNEQQQEEETSANSNDNNASGSSAPVLGLPAGILEDERLMYKLLNRVARGLPIDLDDFGNDDDEEEEPIEYPFSPPSSLKDVADFIQSDKCQSILILAGAGMSVVSGIPDFRSANGLYATLDPDVLTATDEQKQEIHMDPSYALDQTLFLDNPLPCLEVNRSFLLGTRQRRWKATLAHRFVELLHSKTGKLTRLYTQNIDGLEDQCEALPSDKVVNVHGTMDRAECALCHSQVADFDSFCQSVQTQIKDIHGEDDPLAPETSSPIECPTCGHGALKPAITLFRSSLPKRFFELVPHDVPKADLMIVMGTSLRVAPANTLVFRIPEHAMRVVINREPCGSHLGMDFSSSSTRDFFAGGDLDPVCLDLMQELGWLSDLEGLLENDGEKLPASSAELLRQRLLERAERS